MFKRSMAAVLLGSLSLTILAQTAKPPAQAATPESKPGTRWLFAGFKGNSEAGVYYAISRDGYAWQLVNGGRPVIHQTESGELMRDPFVQRGPDGTFRMVWTWAWAQPTVLGYAESADLVHWTPHRQLPVLANEPTAHNAWAPALYYEADRKRWLVFWASTIPGRAAGDGAGDGNHRIYSSTTADFKSFTPARLFFDPGYNVIDATLIPGKDRFVLIFKDERKEPLKKFLQTATGPTMEGPWSHISEAISEPWCEGAAIIRVEGGYLALYDHYSRGQHYGALFSPDLEHWTDATGKLDFPAAMRHGSFLEITAAEFDRLNALSLEMK